MSNKNILALFGCPYPSERESRETEKKQGKAQGVTNQYFIQTAPWIKILYIDRSKAQFTYSCSLERKKTNISEDWRIGPSQLFLSTFYILWLFQGSVLQVILMCKTRWSNLSRESYSLLKNLILKYLLKYLEKVAK